MITLSGTSLYQSAAEPPRWAWFGVQLGTTFGVVFVHWLITASLYRIHALCPYCRVAWVVTFATFWYTTLRGTRVGSALPSVHSGVPALWYVVIAGLILQAFWSYWRTLLRLFRSQELSGTSTVTSCTG